jgi:hypothetical protein
MSCLARYEIGSQSPHFDIDSLGKHLVIYTHIYIYTSFTTMGLRNGKSCAAFPPFTVGWLETGEEREGRGKDELTRWCMEFIDFGTHTWVQPSVAFV